MQIFCSKCGTKINESGVFCPNCGAKIESVSMPINTPDNLSENSQTKKNHKTVGVVASIVIVIAVIGLGSLIKAIFFTDNYEDVASKYVSAVVNFDLLEAYDYFVFDVEEYFDEYIKLYCDDHDISTSEFYERYEDEIDTTVKNYKDIMESYGSEIKEDCQDKYGDYTVSVRVVDSNELTRRELSDAIEESREDFEDLSYSYKDELDFDDYVDENKIKEGYTVDVKYTIDGEDDDESETVTFTIVKYKGNWKVLSFSEMFMYDVV